MHLVDILKGITYKPGWRLAAGADSGRWYIQWQFEGPCSFTGKVIEQPCRKWWLSEWMTQGEVVQTAFMAAMAAEEHECREFFKYQSKRLFGPHIKMEALMEVCDRIEVRA